MLRQRTAVGSPLKVERTSASGETVVIDGAHFELNKTDAELAGGLLRILRVNELLAKCKTGYDEPEQNALPEDKKELEEAEAKAKLEEEKKAEEERKEEERREKIAQKKEEERKELLENVGRQTEVLERIESLLSKER